MEPLREGNYYHIYNRGAGKSPIFWSDSDYKLFLSKYRFYLFIPAETYAWCLLRNHFHLLVRVRTFEEQEWIFKRVKNTFPEKTFYGDHFDSPKPFTASRQLAHLFNSYTKSINKKRSRSGTLVESAFKRKRITDEQHFLHVACYIHRNPVHHKITDDYMDYAYSSFRAIIEGHSSLVDSVKLLTRFGGIENFRQAHREFKELLGEGFYLE